jgi:hypothetical protein
MNDLDDAHEPRFSSDAACEAAGIDSATLKNWISRKPSAVAVGPDERRQVGKKTVYRLSLRRVLQLAIMGELVRLGHAPREAASHAARFTDGDSGPSGGRDSHQPGELFPRNFTLLLVYSATHADVVNARADDAWRVVMRPGPGTPRQPAITMLNLNDIDRRVRTTLGLPMRAREGVI